MELLLNHEIHYLDSVLGAFPQKMIAEQGDTYGLIFRPMEEDEIRVSVMAPKDHVVAKPNHVKEFGDGHEESLFSY